MAIVPGEVVGDRYVVGALLARGGMADVHWADDTRLGRRVALKVFRADTATADDVRRFEREARLLARLNHPNLVRLLDAGHHGEASYLVLQLVDGPTVAQRLRQGPLPFTEAREVGRDVAGALAYVHAQGVVHRDVKPSNVLLEPDGRALLSDFGVAQPADGTQLTATRATVGTAAYLAPEQVGGGPVTGAADVYALGLMLIEALTGRRPFHGPQHEVVVARLVRDPPIPPLVPPSWARLLEAMTRRDPAARPDAAAVAAHLAAPSLAAADLVPRPHDEDEGATTALVASVPAGMTGRAGRWPRRVVAAAAAPLAVLGVVLLAAAHGGGGDGDQQEDAAGARSPATATSAPSSTTATTAVSTSPVDPPSTVASSTTTVPPTTTTTTTPTTAVTTPPAPVEQPVVTVRSVADTCADLDAQKQAVDEEKQRIDEAYRHDRDTRDALKDELDARKRAIDDQRQGLDC